MKCSGVVGEPSYPIYYERSTRRFRLQRQKRAVAPPARRVSASAATRSRDRVDTFLFLLESQRPASLVSICTQIVYPVLKVYHATHYLYTRPEHFSGGPDGATFASSSPSSVSPYVYCSSPLDFAALGLSEYILKYYYLLPARQNAVLRQLARVIYPTFCLSLLIYC